MLVPCRACGAVPLWRHRCTICDACVVVQLAPAWIMRLPVPYCEATVVWALRALRLRCTVELGTTATARVALLAVCGANVVMWACRFRAHAALDLPRAHRQQAEDSFQTELATFQLSMRTKCTRVKERCVKERQAYAAVHADIGAYNAASAGGCARDRVGGGIVRQPRLCMMLSMHVGVQR